MKKVGILLISIICLVSCAGSQKEKNTSTELQPYVVEYAKGFNINRYVDYTEVTVNDPWDSTKILQRYILVNKEKPLPKPMPEGKLIRTPISSAVAYSTIHCSVLDELRAIKIITGVCEPEYVDIPYIKDGINSKSIINLGQASNPNVEKIILLDPEVIFATPIQGWIYGAVEKTGIPIIETPDYMESSPLGRAEWIRFYSVFLENETLADSLFNATRDRYNSIKNKVATTTNRPTVFSDLKYGNTWYTAGGESFLANILKDAGASYIWKDEPYTGAVPLSFEGVLDKAGDADMWLIKYNNPIDMTYNSLAKEYKPYSYFKAFKERNIYECNTNYTKYYEDLPIHPDYILQDMAYVFHPELFPEYSPVYYKKMHE